MKILLTGGGTLGSVTPLLALAEEFRFRMKRDGVESPDIRWIGTRAGVEKAVISEYAIPFIAIFSGKLRHYFDIRNFIDPFLLCIGILQSLYVVWRFQPDVIIGAGGYVSVPVLWAGWLLRKRSVLLQLDLIPSLSNLLTTFCASAVLVACEEEKRYFPEHTTHIVGIPVRRTFFECKERMTNEDERKKMREYFGIHDNLPILLAIGGGTGAIFLNTLITESLLELTEFCHVIHVSGKGKEHQQKYILRQYHPFEFLTDDLVPAMVLADVVVTRAGMGFLAELSFLEKACIVIPIPDSQQERNAVFVEKKHAAIYCSQKSITKELFIEKIKKLLSDTVLSREISNSLGKTFPSDARQRAVDIILSL